MNIIQGIATVMAAIISAIALIKVNKIDNQDRIRRSLWAMEEYLLALGKYIENPSKENLEAYRALYFLCNLYAEDIIVTKLNKIDCLITQNNLITAKVEILDLTNTYSQIYKMKPYSPRKKIFHS